MPNNLSLTEFETTFQTLQFRLTLHIGNRLKTRLLGEFCMLLQSRENAVIHHSYYQELIPHLQQNLAHESISYQPIDSIIALHATVNYIQKSEAFDTQNNGLAECHGTLKSQLVTSLIYVSEFKRSIQFACEDESVGVAFDTFSDVENIDDFCQEAERQALPDHLLEMFKKIRDDMDASTTGFCCSKIWIPLVEKFEDTPGEGHIVGTIYPLELDVEARQENRFKDIISFNNHPLDQDDLVNYQAQDAILAARNEHAFLNRQSTTRYTVTFGFPSTAYSYSGSSFGFGMAILALCTLEREANLRKQSYVSKSIAITGGIDLTGRLRAVSSQGLQEKIGAAFFSPLSGLVLPLENAKVGQIILDDLLEKYPKKKFSIIPESTLPGILDNPHLLKYENIPLSVWTRNHFTRFRVVQIISIMLIAVILTIGGLSVITDQNPSEYKVEGEKVILFNNTGKYLWELELGHAPGYLEVDRPQKSIYRRLHIDDYDGDGENEVILGTAVKQHKFNGRLYFIETDGSVKWMFSEHPILRFGNVEYTDNYGVGFIYPYKHKDSPKHDIYTRFSHMPWFPNRLVRFDTDGNQLDEFIHPGGIYDMEIHDLNGDGEPEILLGCTNNAFNEAAVAILPSRGFKGTAPRWEDSRKLEGGEVDSNLIYIKFPHWGIYDILGTNARSHVNDIFLDSHEGFIVNVALGGSTEVGSYLYSFDLNLNLVGLSVSDGYLSQYHKEHGHDFFTRFDKSDWYEQMTALDVWRNGRWTKVSTGS